MVSASSPAYRLYRLPAVNYPSDHFVPLSLTLVPTLVGGEEQHFQWNAGIDSKQRASLYHSICHYDCCMVKINLISREAGNNLSGLSRMKYAGRVYSKSNGS